MDSFLNVGLTALAVVVALLVVGFALARLYKRASKDTAYVRTGLGGSKVIQDGGAIVLPVLHETIPVTLSTIKLTVRRTQQEALITLDKYRADVIVEFYVRVTRTKEAIATAAESLGHKTNDPEELKALVEGKFVDALRSVAASMNLDQLHVDRAEFIQQVQKAANVDLQKNGLELESASLVGLDQTEQKHFNPDNSFDAEGLTRLKEITEQRRQERNKIERETDVTISEQDRDARLKSLDIERATQEAQLEQERDLANRKAQTEAESAAEESKGRQAAEQAKIGSERQIAEADIERQKAVELANQRSAIEVAEQSRAKSAAEAEASRARAAAAKAEEEVQTARAVENANRAKAVALVKASEEAEQEAIGVRVEAEAERQAAEEKAQAITIAASAEAEAEKTRAEAKAATYRVEAEGQRAINAARNILDSRIVDMEVRLKVIEGLPAVIEAASKPLESIDSIKLVQLGGLDGILGGASSGGSASGGDSLADQVVGAALKHQVGKDMIGDLLSSAGYGNGSDLKSLMTPATATLNGASVEDAEAKEEAAKTEEPKAATPKPARARRRTRGKAPAGEGSGGKAAAADSLGESASAAE